MAEPKLLNLTDEEINEALRTDGASLEDTQEESDQVEELDQEDTEEQEESSQEDDQEDEDSDESEEEEETEEPGDDDEAEEEEDSDESEEEDEDEIPEIEGELEIEEDVDFSEISNGLFSSREEMEQLLSDDYLRQAIEYYKEAGTLTPYAMARTYGSEEYWSKVSDIDVMRQQIQLDYADVGLNEEEISDIIEDELSQYNLDPEEATEAEIRKAKTRLKVAASKARKGFVSEYSKFAEPPKKEPSQQPATPQKSPEEIEREMRENKAKLSKSIDSAIKDKKLTFKAGKTNVEMQVDKKSLIEFASSQKNILKSLFKGNDLDWETIAILSNKEAYKAAIQNASSKDGTKEFVDRELKNKPNRKGKNGSGGIQLGSNGLPHPKHWKIVKQD